MEAPDTLTQRKQIGKALKSGRRISPQDALREFGCFRLAARIHELRKMGWAIERTTHERGYAVYWLKP